MSNLIYENPISGFGKDRARDSRNLIVFSSVAKISQPNGRISNKLSVSHIGTIFGGKYDWE
jgi:hypothetical protein